MSLSEFQLITKYFDKKNQNKDVILGIGDDCAILKYSKKEDLLISVDTLIAGRHFPKNTKPFDIGYKSLAVNLSDLAACGAKPLWATMSLSLPSINQTWLQEFSRGFFSLLNKYHMQLIGGDITKGDLSITVQIHGTCPHQKALRRDGAKINDKIFVTGSLGTAGFYLHTLNNKIKLSATDKKILSQKLNQPIPRIEIAQKLRGIASSAIDISDGLLADLNHILERSRCGANVFSEKIPVNSNIQKYTSFEKAKAFALCAGDDYELCFTVPPQKISRIKALQKIIPITYIGDITEEKKLLLDGKKIKLDKLGYRHF